MSRGPRHGRRSVFGRAVRAAAAMVVAAGSILGGTAIAHADPPMFSVNPSSLTVPSLTSNAIGRVWLQPTFDPGYSFSAADSRDIVDGTEYLTSLSPFHCDTVIPGFPCLLEWDWVSATPSMTLRIAECTADHSSCHSLDYPVTVSSAAARMPASQPASIAFGDVLVGTTVTRTVPVDLDPGFTLNNAAGGLPPFHFSFATCDAHATGPCSVQESFAPTSVGAFHSSMGFEECTTGVTECISDYLVPTTLTGTGVSHSSSSVSITASPNPVRFGSAVVLTATVTPYATGASPSGTVSFTDDGVSLGSLPLSSSDTATLSTADLHPGINRITATYSGDTNFTGSTSAPLEVSTTFDRCVTGSSGIPVVVASGEAVCVTGSHAGVVTVNRGGSLAIEGGFSGAITANGADSISICGATLSGAVSISNATGPVVIGGGQAWCPGNHVGGDVSLRANHGGLIVAANTVTGVLTCTTNAPPPDDRGYRNTVVGARVGQCAAPAF